MAEILCPNCHSQTLTFGITNKGAYSNGQRDHVQTVESVSSSLTAPTKPQGTETWRIYREKARVVRAYFMGPCSSG